MKTKLFAILMTITFVLNQFAFGVLASKNTDDYADEIEIIKQLDLLTVKEYDSQSTVQRRDLAEIVAKILAPDSTYDSTKQVFQDVGQDDEKFGYINKAYEMGILNGYFDGSFNPFRVVTYSEASKTLVEMLGYGELAQAKGGYPFGYQKVAADLEINLGINRANDDIVTLGELCAMVVAALETKVMLVAGMTQEDTIYSAKGEETLLSRMNIEIVKGRMTANYMTDLSGGLFLEKNELALDGHVYQSNLFEIQDALGKYLKCYIKKDGLHKNVVAFQEDVENSKEVIVDAEDLFSVSSSSVEYFDASGNRKRIALSGSAEYVYNGELEEAWTEKNIPKENASLRFVDADGNHSFELVFIESGTNLIVKSFSTKVGVLKFYDKNDQEKVIDLFDEDIHWVLKDADGNVASYEDIQVDDMLYVSEGNEKKTYILHFEKGSVEGIASSITDKEITIGDVKYKLDRQMNQYSHAGTIELNKQGIFYLDYRGRVAAVSYSTGLSRNYAYLVGMTEFGFFGTTVQLKLFCSDSTFKILELAEKLEINGESLKAEKFLDDWRFVKGGEVIPQLVAYEINDEGKLSQILSAKDGKAYTDDEERYKEFTLDETSTNFVYRSGSMSMANTRWFITDNSLFFAIPTDINDEDNFFIIKKTGLVADTAYSNCKVYDVDPNNKLSVAVFDSKISIFDVSRRYQGIITDVSVALDAEGKKTPCVSMIRGANSAPTDVFVTDDILLSGIYDPTLVNSFSKDGKNYIKPEDLQVGDILQYYRDIKGKNISFKLLYRQGSKIEKEIGEETINDYRNTSAGTYCFATIDKVLDKAIRLKIPNSGGTQIYERVYPIMSATALLKYDAERQTVKTITPEEINAGEKVFVFIQYTSVRLMIIY